MTLRRISLHLICITWITLLSPNIHAQQFTRLDVPFLQQGVPLQHALVGGLNTPQLAELDLNQDGIQDLLIFDRVGFLPLTFINGGTPNEVDYRYAPEFEHIFPESLDNWVVPRDYNADGIMDLFVHPTTPGIDGIMVYQGYYEDGKLQFEQLRFPQNSFDLLYFPISGSGSTQIYVSSIDYPTIDDMDADGDLDIVTFNAGGGYIEYYQNFSVERGFGTDSLLYELTDPCWGGIYESGITVEVNLSDSAGGCSSPLTDEGEVSLRHAGSSLLALDYNGDGLKDMILGDLSFNNLNLLINGGDRDEAWMVAQVNDFPSDTPVDITTFPSAFYLDVNNDGVKDLVTTPSARGRGDNYRNVWLHLNNGATDRPDFIFETDRFLVDQMIDVGADAKPVLVDVNADGLLDLLVGNQWLYSRDNNEDARIFYYENVGTASAPSFQLADEDWMRLSQFNNTTFDFAPAFGDLDADGDLDMIIGDDKGKLFFSENEGGTTGAMVFNNFVYAYMDIDVGKAARPQIIDLNGDGLLDLVLGERGGNNNVDGSGVCGTLNYYQNVGTINAPQFNTVDGGKPDLAPNTSCLGQVLTIPPNGVLSYSDPVFWDYGDRRELFVGTEFGDVIRYNNITTNPNDVYQIESANVLSTYVGARISPALADINGDKKLDMVVGNARGGLSFFTSDIEVETPASATDLSEDLQLSIFPNPAASSFEIRLHDESIADYRCQVEVFGVNGQLMYRAAMTNPWTRIESKDWSPGLYMVKVSSREQQSYRKIIIQ